MPPENDGKQVRRMAYRLAGAGFEFAGVVAAFCLLGWWLDRKLDTAPWLLVTGLVISFVGGMYRLWKIGKESFD